MLTTIYFLKISTHLFCANKLKGFFFQGLEGVFLTTAKLFIWHVFLAQKLILYFFFQVSSFNFNALLKTCCGNLFRKTEKKL